METFLVHGLTKVKQRVTLKLPPAKHFGEFKNEEEGEDENAACLEMVFINAIERQKDFGVSANHFGLLGSTKHARALSSFLSKHPFPFAQGPVKLPIDCKTEEYKTIGEVITEKTVFEHEDNQVCAEWLPLVTGTLAWESLREVMKHVIPRSLYRGQPLQGTWRLFTRAANYNVPCTVPVLCVETAGRTAECSVEQKCAEIVAHSAKSTVLTYRESSTLRLIISLL